MEGQLRQAILEHRLRPGIPLPGMRTLARELGVAAITVITAYDQLTAEGWLEPRPGRGTLVAPDLPVVRRATGARLARTPGDALPTLTAIGPDRPFFDRCWSPVRYDFRAGSTRLDVFPVRVWGRLLQAAWRDLSSSGEVGATGYGQPAGDVRLRHELAAYLGRARAVAAEPDQVVITSGAQGALVVAGRMWLGGGRRL
ncbi:MAG: aminotransferase class I/II-fold pyridoxal phosphate-dependent enzyme, partial [Candidatus Limnocylindrales bacterium]